MSANGQALPPGTLVGDLQILQVLGTGAFGISYLAADPAIGTRFVLKEYLPAGLVARQPDGSLAPEDEHAAKQFAAGLRQFLAEGRMIAALEHPNLVQLLRYFEALGSAWFVMPWRPGKTLAERLASGQPLEPQAARDLLRQMLDTLAYLHARDIVHQDIKPANILLTDEGPPLLLDFGVAAAHGAGPQAAPMGSAGYAAPEQSEAGGNIGPWTDCYGLAATLYRAITGDIPPPAAERQAALSDGAPDPLERLSTRVQRREYGSLVDVVEQGLELDIDLRPADAETWRTSFASLDWRRTVTSQPARPSEPERREWLPMVLVTSVLLVLLAAVLWLFNDDAAGPDTHATGQPQAGLQVASSARTSAEETSRWQAALDADTLEGYRRFMADFPESVYLQQADIQLDILDDRLWAGLSEENTLGALEDYLGQFPNGRHQAEAMQRIDAFRQAEALAARQRAERERLESQAWDSARNAGTLAALEQYIADWPTGTHITEARSLHRQLLDRANDSKAFQAALQLNTRTALQAYINAFPSGQHVSEALARIDHLTLRPGKRFMDCPVCPPMVVVPAGSFQQGSASDAPLALSAEQPQRTVTIGRPFAIGQFEVTMAQWDACFDAGGCSHRPDDNGWGRADRPVMLVTWNEVQEYLEWLSELTGERYRLPSESEWEYAARAGVAGDWISGDAARLCTFANIAGSETGFQWQLEDCADPQALGTLPVGYLAANGFGLHDVIGNVSEWTADCMNLSYVDAPTDGSAWGRGICSSHMTRGGSWVTGSRDVRLASRFNLKNGDRNDFTGFRVVRAVAEQ